MGEKITLTFLGTGSAVPTVKRNHIGILLSHGSENLLIDCGEGTQRQFRKAGLNPCKVTRLLITHWHADHTLGIPGLLETLAMSEYPKNLKIYGPKATKKNLRLFEEIYGRFRIEKEIKEASGKFLDTDEFYIEAKSLEHSKPCLGYSIVFKDKLRINKQKLKKLKLPNSPLIKKLQEGRDITIEGKKIRSGDVTYLEKGKKITVILDTALTNKTVQLAKGSDILICESTFSSSDKKKAKEYKHLTAEQAATIAKKAKVKKLILTHFSQRYEKSSKKLLEEAKKIFKDTEVTKDLDKILI